MIRQVELTSKETNEAKIFWLEHDPYDNPLRVGTMVTLLGILDYFTISRLFIGVPDGTLLPPKSRVGQILHYAF